MASTAPEENNKWVPNSYGRTLLRLAFECGGNDAEQQAHIEEKNAVCVGTSSEDTASAEQADSTRFDLEIRFSRSTRFDLENLICQGLSPTARAPHKFVASQSHPTYYCAKCGFTANNKRFHI